MSTLPDLNNTDLHLFSGPYVPEFGENVYVLTERLYGYRAFLPEELFQKLHRYKRILQDAKVILNRLSRDEIVGPVRKLRRTDLDFWQTDSEVESAKQQPEENSQNSKDEIEARFREQCEEATAQLKEIYEEVDVLHVAIISDIHRHMKSILFKPGEKGSGKSGEKEPDSIKNAANE